LSYYWAKFEKRNKDTFRFDTRIYLELINKPSVNDICIGAIVGKNPGAAIPSSFINNQLQKVDLDGDKLLPNIKSIFLKAYMSSNKQMNKNCYIQVLNLIYICYKNLSEATKKKLNYPNQINCDTEKKHFPFVWYVWGDDNKKLNMYKERFYHLKADKSFYLNTKTEKVISLVPDFKAAARHTQGLRHDLVVTYISNII